MQTARKMNNPRDFHEEQFSTKQTTPSRTMPVQKSAENRIIEKRIWGKNLQFWESVEFFPSSTEPENPSDCKRVFWSNFLLRDKIRISMRLGTRSRFGLLEGRFESKCIYI
jgi:hypothetical protein